MSEQEQKKGEAEERIVMPRRGGGSLRIAIVTLAVVVVVIVAVLASGVLNSNAAKTSVTLTGAGSTLVMPLMLKWADEYYTVTNHRVQVNYGGGGSGAGITQIEASHVNFAGTDVPLGSAEAAKYGLVTIAETIGAVVVAYNEPTVRTLRLDGPTLERSGD